MGWITADQLERARELHVYDYVTRYESSDYKRVGRGYRLIADDALAVDGKGWYCHKRCKGSRTALDYLVEIKGYGLVDAACKILNESPHERSGKAKSNKSTSSIKGKNAPSSKENPPKSRPPPAIHDKAQHNNTAYGPITPTISDITTGPLPQSFPIDLPQRHKDNKRVIAYLQSREIDKDLIMACINRGVLYESKYYHNCVFLGKDEYGKTKFAAMRSTTTSFMRDADGSDKRYGFILPPNNPNSRMIAVYEAPIDCLSHQTLCKQDYMPPFDGWRLSLGGISPLALEHFLENNQNVIHCVIATDNDEAGKKIAKKIALLAVTPGNSAIYGITTERSLPPYGDDWNRTLEIIKKTERTHHKVQHSKTPDL